ncbi:MAG TPA: hypothetical protein VJH20_05785 [Candidatus Nanoarchaeia archaeon]|nr:hypothetical protein [Candidatus Nanoarchaeia archaeon]
MKKTLLLLFFVLLLGKFAQAGLVWRTESQFIQEGETKCIEYGLYNPGGEDLNIALYVSGDITKIAQTEKSESVLIKANTLHDNAINKQLCFRAPQNVFNKDCILPTIGCQQTCQYGNVEYSGDISTIAEKVGQGSGGQGSSVIIAETAPLSLVVKCEESPRNFSTAYLYGIIIIIIIIALTYIGVKKARQRKR